MTDAGARTSGRARNRATRVLEAYCASRGWPASAFRRAPEGRTNAVFLGDTLGVVVLVAAPGVGSDVVAHRMELARAVARQAPFVRPSADEPLPVTTDEGVLSVWDLVPTVPDRDVEAVGHAVARLHAVDGTALRVGSVALGPARVMADTAAWIDGLARDGRLRPADARVLSSIDDRLLGVLGPPDAAATGLLHGDLYWPNVLTTSDGAVLCDADELGLGSPEYDVALLLDPDRGSLRATDVEAFASGYGAPVPDAATRRLLVQRSHLTFTLRLVEHAHSARGRFWVDQWMAGWRRVAADPTAGIIPPRERSRLEQLGVVVRGPVERRRHDGPGDTD